MSLFETLLSPKVHAHLTVRAKTEERRYSLLNLIKAWGLPGTIRVAGDGYLFVDLEGPKSVLQRRIEELAHNVLVIDSSLVTKWLPYTGHYNYLAVSH